MRYVAALPSTAILAGSVLGLLLREPPVLPAAVVLTACAVSSFWCWRAGGGWMLALFAAGAFFSGATLLSASAWQRAWRPPLRAAFEAAAAENRRQAAADGRRMPAGDEAPMAIEGLLRADAAPSDAGVSLSVDVERAWGPGGRDMLPSRRRALGGVVVTVAGELAAGGTGEWRAGRRVRMPATLRPASRYLNPGVPDAERALARRGTTLVGTVKSGALVEVTARAVWWRERLGAARAFARRAIVDHVGRWSVRSAAIVAAIVIGDRSALDAALQRRLQEAGTYHVIAISGGNIAILTGLLLGAFRLAGMFGRAAMAAAIGLIAVYAEAVGGGASVDRATLMAVVYLGARVLDLRSPPLNAIAVVAGLLAAWDPLSIAEPAFLLTFGATLAILLAVPGNGFPGRSRVAAALAATFLSSLAAEALLFPIAATYFERVTFAGLALNLLAIPLMGLAQVAGMLVVPAALVSGRAASAAGWLAHAGAAGLVGSADLVRLAPAVTWRVAAPALMVCVVYYAALASAWYARRARRVAAPVAIAAALWILADPRTLAAARGDGRLHVTFLDVGQGDATFVVFPRGSTILVDTGGLGGAAAFDVGDRVIGPAIRAAGFARLDRVVLSHGDADHVGGALAVIDDFRPRDVIEGIPVPRSETLARLRAAAAAARAGWANVYTPYRIVVDEVEVVVWHPRPAEWERQKVRNDDSLVMELRWRGASVMLTGDIGREAEHELAPAIPPAQLRVVKIPHHGSPTSSSPEFVAAMKPRVAVASAGRHNRFGHPAPEVLQRWESAGAEVFRTDRDGAVFVETDGSAVSVRSFTGRRAAVR